MKLELVLQKLGLIQPGKIMYIGGSARPARAAWGPEDERRAIEAPRRRGRRRGGRSSSTTCGLWSTSRGGLKIRASISRTSFPSVPSGSSRPSIPSGLDRNIKLATYSSRCIENEILMHIRKIANQKTEVSLDEPINTDWDGNELLLLGHSGHGRGYRHAPAGGRRGPPAAAAGTRPAAGAGKSRSSPCASASAGGRRRRRRGRGYHGHSQSYISRLKSASCCGCGGDLNGRSTAERDLQKPRACDINLSIQKFVYRYQQKGSGHMEKDISRNTSVCRPYLCLSQKPCRRAAAFISAGAGSGLHMGEVQVRKDLALVPPAAARRSAITVPR